jgi:hypothetical protein
LKKRSKRSTAGDEKQQLDAMTRPDEEEPFLDGPTPAPRDAQTSPESLSWAQRNQWIVFALASGACAAFNGVFAKL